MTLDGTCQPSACGAALAPPPALPKCPLPSHLPQGAADRKPAARFGLSGATIVEGALAKPSAGSPGMAVVREHALVFHVVGAGGKEGPMVLSLRAATAAAKAAWVKQLQAVLAGSGGDSSQEAAKPAAVAVRRASTGNSEDAEAGAAGQGGVPRKISTAVFADQPPPTAAEEEEAADLAAGEQESDPEAAAAAQLAAEKALVAEIQAQAARRTLRPGERAVLEAAVKVRTSVGLLGAVASWRGGGGQLLGGHWVRAHLPAPAALPSADSPHSLPTPCPPGNQVVRAWCPQPPAGPGSQDHQQLHAVGTAGGAGPGPAGGGAAARGGATAC